MSMPSGGFFRFNFLCFLPATKAAMVPWGLGLEKDNISRDCDIKHTVDNKLYIVQKKKNKSITNS